MRVIPLSDYCIEFFISNGITDVFGYQGGMVCHFYDSLGKYNGKIKYHCFGNEQGAILAACSFAQSTGKLGVCITTSGPGFTNALTGLANAWFDSIPVMLISGQVNTKDKRRNYSFRQYGFQEMQTVELVNTITKRAYEIDDDTDVVSVLQDAYLTAFDKRRGPVFLDFPINISRKQVEVEETIQPVEMPEPECFDASSYIEELLDSNKPIIIAGAGIKQLGLQSEFRELVNLLKIPVVTTMPSVDLLPSDSPYFVGYLGGTARRESGIVLKNTDCVLSLGTRLCNKAIGYNHADFIPKATKLIRVDIDETEFERQLKECEQDVIADLRSFMKSSIEYARKNKGSHDHSLWVESVNKLKELVAKVDNTFGNEIVRRYTELIPDRANITFDVGNNQVYGAQSSVIKKETRVFESCGLGAMGYAIPAAIGASIGNSAPTYVITGDGGAQMNIQELNTISKKNLPVKILVLNNHALGHIILFQEHYLDNRFVATREVDNDYYSCDFVGIAKAYGIKSFKIKAIEDLNSYISELNDDNPYLFEVEFDNCPMLPNIHGGLDPLTNGPVLPEGLVEAIKAIMT